MILANFTLRLVFKLIVCIVLQLPAILFYNLELKKSEYLLYCSIVIDLICLFIFNTLLLPLILFSLTALVTLIYCLIKRRHPLTGGVSLILILIGGYLIYCLSQI